MHQVFYTAAFTVELTINMFANFVRPFFKACTTRTCKHQLSLSAPPLIKNLLIIRSKF